MFQTLFDNSLHMILWQLLFIFYFIFLTCPLAYTTPCTWWYIALQWSHNSWWSLTTAARPWTLATSPSARASSRASLYRTSPIRPSMYPCWNPINYSWWHHGMEVLSLLMVLCVGNPPVTGGFPTQRASDAEVWWCLWCQPLNPGFGFLITTNEAAIDLIFLAYHHILWTYLLNPLCCKRCSELTLTLPSCPPPFCQHPAHSRFSTLFESCPQTRRIHWLSVSLHTKGLS